MTDELAEIDARIDDAKRHLSELFAERRVIKEKRNPRAKQRRVDRDLAVSLVKAGKSLKSIAAEIGFSLGTIRNHLRWTAEAEAEASLPPPPPRPGDLPYPSPEHEEASLAYDKRDSFVGQESHRILAGWLAGANAS